MNTGDKCYIVTTEGQYCKLNEHNDLVIARDHSEAVLFLRQEAETRISKGRKSYCYRIETAPLPLAGQQNSAPKTATIVRMRPPCLKDAITMGRTCFLICVI